MEISEVDLIKEIQGLMLNERLVPEPQFSCKFNSIIGVYNLNYETLTCFLFFF